MNSLVVNMKEQKTPKASIMILVTHDQMEMLNQAWKNDKKALNRSKYIKDALNAYSGIEIF